MIESELFIFLGKICKTLTTFQNNSFSHLEQQKDNSLKLSAVLVPFAFHEDELKLIFTRRSLNLERHKGQVSFPGGIIEQNDKDPVASALRETFEEIGIKKEKIRILGAMPPFDSSTGYYIFPIVGFIEDLNGLHKNGIEVDRIFCIPYAWLKNPKNYFLKDYSTPEGLIRKVWFYREYDGEKLWGITAKITRDFIDLIEN